jgi:hypothetical protein
MSKINAQSSNQNELANVDKIISLGETSIRYVHFDWQYH